MKHFTIKELCTSVRAEELGLDNNPTPKVCTSLEALVDNILDPAREALGRVIYVNSGYRSMDLNKAVGGAVSSQHCTGEAADIELGGRTITENKELFDWIAKNCIYDQLINEYNYSWVHVSYRKGNNRKQQLIIG